MSAFPAGYARTMLGPREPVLDAILRRSLTAGMPTIQIDDNAGRLLQLLTGLQRPRRVIEIGTLFGYSTIHLARGLPDGGRITTLEIDPAAAELARENLAAAGVGDRVDVVVGDAVEYLKTVEPASAGLVFVDADKKNYPVYLRHVFPLLEPGGLLIADDAFAAGDFSGESESTVDNAEVHKTEVDDAEVRGILAYASAVGRSPRLFSAFAGTGHGMLISRKES